MLQVSMQDKASMPNVQPLHTFWNKALTTAQGSCILPLRQWLLLCDRHQLEGASGKQILPVSI